TALPPEFTLLRFEPELWSGADVLAWVKMMAWDLSANYPFELLRHDILQAVGEQKLAELMPPYAKDGLSILGGSGWSGWSGGSGRSGGSGAADPADPTYLTSSWFSALAGDPS